MSSALSRISWAARRMIVLRCAGVRSRHTSNPRCAASRARSRSLIDAWATEPITSPVAGLWTGIVRPSAASTQASSMKSEVFG